MRPLLLLCCAYLLALANAWALDVYKAGNSMVTGTWNGNGTLSEVSGNQPYEGTQHYQFTYTIGGFWAGYGLNMDNWGNTAPRNLSGFTHMRIAYRGMSGDHQLRIQLRNNAVYGTVFTLGPATGAYQVIDIPVISLVGGSYIDMAAIREIDISVGSDANTGSGNVYIDAIEMLNLPLAPPSNAWARTGELQRGFNLSNWLEAWWLLPFNTYPEVDQFNREKIKLLFGMGYKSIRMPVIFERLGATTPPYALDTNHLAFDLIDSVIVWARDYDMSLIIDNHHGLDLTDANYASQIPRLCAVWRQIVQKYSYLDPARTFFELYNEATSSISNTHLQQVMQAIRDTIRNHNTTHTLIVGANGWNSANGLLGFNPINESNIIYTFHSYTPYMFTHQGMGWTSPPYLPARNFPLGSDLEDMRLEFRSARAWSDYYDIPVFLGEFGVATSANTASKCAWVDHISFLADSVGIGHFYWDVFRWNEAFGFFQNGVLQLNQVIPCFAEAFDLNLVPLSVHFEGVAADCRASGAAISWKAQVSDEGSTFYLERSENGLDWQYAGLREPAEKGRREYRFYPDPGALSDYYRICYQMPDGKKQYSRVLHFACALGPGLTIYPNPSGEALLQIQIPEGPGKGSLKLYNAQGQILAEHNPDEAAGSLLRWPLPGLVPGVYQVIWQSGSGRLLRAPWVYQP